MPTRYSITRTVENDGIWLRILQNGTMVKMLKENKPTAFEEARAIIEQLKNPPHVQLVYEEVVP